MSFEKEFEKWLEKSLKKSIPSEVVAFSFNLFEPALEEGVTFGIELIGASEFYVNDENWACEEIWQPKKRSIFIPTEYSGEDWEECLKKLIHFITNLLSSNKAHIEKLKSKKGIGIGFVDGDLEIIWQP